MTHPARKLYLEDLKKTVHEQIQFSLKNNLQRYTPDHKNASIFLSKKTIIVRQKKKTKNNDLMIFEIPKSYSDLFFRHDKIKSALKNT